MKKIIMLLVLSGLIASGAFAQISSCDTLVKNGKILEATFLQRVDSTKALFKNGATVIELLIPNLAKKESGRIVYVREIITYISFHDTVIEMKGYKFIAIKHPVANPIDVSAWYWKLEWEKKQLEARENLPPNVGVPYQNYPDNRPGFIPNSNR